MKTFSFLFLFLISSTFTFSQIQGKISDATTNEPIPFVNIGITKLAKGTVSDDFGNYELEATSPTDTVTISAIGFFPQKKSVKALLENGDIFLQQQTHEIQTINLTATAFGKEERFGKKNKNRGLSVGFGNRQLGCAVGSKISIKKETYLKSANFKINHAEGDSLLFRVNIFHFEDGVVGENILQENIILNMAQKRGILTVDLTPYELIIDHDVLLMLEWVKDDNGKGNGGITFDTKKGRKSNIYERKTSQAPFKINSAFGRRGFKKKSLCFWLMGKEVKK